MRFISPRASGRITLVLLLLLLLLVPAASAQLPDFGCEGTPGCSIIAGTGEPVTDDASRGDGGPATAARFNIVDGLDWAGDGSILIADGQDARIRHIRPSGNIRTNGSSDGVDDPIAVISTGWYPNEPFVPHSFLVADVGDDTVEDWFLEFSAPPSSPQWTHTDAMEQIDVTDIEYSVSGFWAADPGGGTVWFVRFIGFPTSAWQRTPQLENLDDPRGIGPIPGQGFLVATNGDCQIRRHTDNGTVVVAGTGFCAGASNGGNGDGGPATASHLGHPTDVEATPDGGFVLTERDRVRRVAPDGTISTLYVTGFSCPDCATPSPSALELTGDDGDVLIGLDRQVLRFDTNYAPPATPTPTPTPTPDAPPAQASLLDTTTPGLALGGKKTQKAGKTVSVVVSATTEDLFASASGNVSVPGASKVYRLKAVKNRFVARGTKATLKLKVPKKAQKAIKKALRRGKKVKASIKLSARDGAGNLTPAKRTIKLKR